MAASLAAARSILRSELRPAKQVPVVARNVDEHRDAPIRLLPRLRHELDAGAAHSRVSGVEVVDAQEEADPTRELSSHDGLLLSAVGACQQNARLGTRWANDDPAFWASVVRERRRIFCQRLSGGKRRKSMPLLIE